MKDNQELKFSIVTAVYNGEKYLEETMLSIKNQSYKNFEHIIVDGGSTDGTLDIIKKYENTYPMKYISEKDNGMYDAINKGFAMASGDVYAWLNSDDVYYPHALDTVAKVMKAREIKWCTGTPMTFTADGHTFAMPKVMPIYFQSHLRKGYCDGRISSMVQQESTFFRRDLWQQAGGLNPKYQYAGDYWLWVEFAKYEKLYTLDAVLAGFRMHQEQKSSAIDKYFGEMGKFTWYKRFLAKTKFIRLMTYLRTLGRVEQFVKVRELL